MYSGTKVQSTIHCGSAHTAFPHTVQFDTVDTAVEYLFCYKRRVLVGETVYLYVNLFIYLPVALTASIYADTV